MQNERAKAYDDHFKDVKYLLRALIEAKKSFLDVEFMSTFLEDYQSTDNIVKSTNHAMREWDL